MANTKYFNRFLGWEIPGKRILDLETKKRNGWWLETIDGEHRLMNSREFWITLSVREAHLFDNLTVQTVIPEITDTTLKAKIEYSWSRKSRLKSLEVDLEDEIIRDHKRHDFKMDRNAVREMVSKYNSLITLQNRIKLLTPPKGKIRTWAEFLRPENSKTTVRHH